jgi:hypothetical protein
MIGSECSVSAALISEEEENERESREKGGEGEREALCLRRPRYLKMINTLAK